MPGSTARTSRLGTSQVARAGISRTATLKERPSPEGVKLVDIEIRVQGMKPGKHAVHIHEVGTCDPCGAAKGHFDPGPNSNSSPDGRCVASSIGLRQ